MHKPSDYKAIYQWHKQSGSRITYINGMQELAAHEQAPLDAIYLRADGSRWVCVSDLHPQHSFRIAYEQQQKAHK